MLTIIRQDRQAVNEEGSGHVLLLCGLGERYCGCLGAGFVGMNAPGTFQIERVNEESAKWLDDFLNTKMKRMVLLWLVLGR